MAVSFHSDDIEMIQEEDYDDIDAQAPEEDVKYETVGEQTPDQLEQPAQSVSRRVKLVGMAVGLLCVVQALLNITLRLSLYSEWMKEKDGLVEDLNQMKDNLTDLTDQRDRLQARFDELQSTYDRLTERDDIKRTLCETDGFTFDGGVCYYVSDPTERKTWSESRTTCRDRLADLVVINLKEKQDFVARVVPRDQRVWIGLTDAEREGFFTWVDGTPLTSLTYWNPGQPRDKDNHCGYYINVNVTGSGWTTAVCAAPLSWMCERAV